MESKYNPPRSPNSQWTYKPGVPQPFRLSRAKIDLFLKCPRCFYLDLRLGVKRPPTLPYTINICVDELLKKEFDAYRKSKMPHPIMLEHKLQALPFWHKNLHTWRNPFRGIEFYHEPSNLTVFGGVDDVWVCNKDHLIIVDYKATSTKELPTELNKPWHIYYTRQLEVYQWLFKQKGFNVWETAYILYVNAMKSPAELGGSIRVERNLLSHTGETHWVEPTLMKMKETLELPTMPTANPDCDHCRYRKAALDQVMKEYYGIETFGDASRILAKHVKKASATQ